MTPVKDDAVSLAEELKQFQSLRDLFNYLLLRTNGDPEQALDLMRQLQGLGHLDPNVDVDRFREELEKQQAFVKRIVARFDETHEAIRSMRRVREQLDDAVARARAAGLESEDLAESAKALSEKLTAIEDELIQTQNQVSQDPLNFPSKLDDQLAFLYGHSALPYGGPDVGSSRRLADIEAVLQPHLDAVGKVFYSTGLASSDGPAAASVTGSTITLGTLGAGQELWCMQIMANLPATSGTSPTWDGALLSATTDWATPTTHITFAQATDTANAEAAATEVRRCEADVRCVQL